MSDGLAASITPAEMRRKNSVVAVAGNIGAGKTTLSIMLADRLEGVAVLEPADANPYLSDFYRDMKRWSFQSQIFFLSRRLLQYRLVAQTREQFVIQDRTAYEDAEIFARKLRDLGHFTDRDWRLYQDFYDAIRGVIMPPALVIYLRASVDTLVRRVKLRGHEYEVAMSAEYLSDLNRAYDQWALDFTISPIVTIDTDVVNFVDDPAELETIAQSIFSRVG